MTNKQPIRPTTTQCKRILLEPVGGGVLLYRQDEKRVEVVEIAVDMASGEITQADGQPLVFWVGKDKAVGYRLVQENRQRELLR